jgi:hypothetical protein
LTRTLFLHVGPAKTGTSAVQHVLQRHDNSVVIYPKVGLWADGSHHNLILNYFGEYMRPEVVREEAADLLARIGTEAKRTNRDIVISSEILAGRKDLAGFAAALEQQIGESLRVELVMVVREHFERAASLYNQRVKDGVTGEKRDPDAFLAAHAQGMCYSNFLKRVRNTRFDVCVLNYHPPEDCVERVLAHFGLAQTIIDQPPRNVSLSRPALVAALAGNRAAGSQEERNRFVAGLRRMPDFHAPAGFIFGTDAAFAAERKFKKDRNFLLRRFDIELPLPDFPADRMAFRINEEEFRDISTIAAPFGSYGQRIIEAVQPYIRVNASA